MSRPRGQLRPAVADLMAAVRALPPLSMETVGAAARLALPQIGCSNLRWVKGRNYVAHSKFHGRLNVIACMIVLSIHMSCHLDTSVLQRDLTQPASCQLPTSWLVEEMRLNSSR